MFALGLKRTISLLLAATLLSSQLIASVPSLCGCAGSETESRSCCSGTNSLHDDTPSGDNGTCCCDTQCVDELSQYDCGCSSDSNEEQAPNERDNRIRLGEDHGVAFASSAFDGAHQVDGEGASDLASQPRRQTSTQILHCVWQV